jgi:hypothetical protein
MRVHLISLSNLTSHTLILMWFTDPGKDLKLPLSWVWWPYINSGCACPWVRLHGFNDLLFQLLKNFFVRGSLPSLSMNLVPTVLLDMFRGSRVEWRHSLSCPVWLIMWVLLRFTLVLRLLSVVEERLHIWIHEIFWKAIHNFKYIRSFRIELIILNFK